MSFDLSASTGFHALAIAHQLAHPNDTRTLDQIAAHYRGMQQTAPVGRLIVRGLYAEAACDALNSMSRCDAAMIDDGERLADIWRHLGPDEMHEQVDAHLESSWPDVSYELRDQIVSRVCR